MNKIQEAMDNLEKVLRVHSADTVVSFGLFFNCEGREVIIKTRTHEELAAQGISMRNLAGNFIKQEVKS